MPNYQGEKDYIHGREESVGILVVNLGTPDAPTSSALRRYLGEFLWDPRVVEIPRPVWWLILNLFVLTTRPSKSAHAYKSIWTEDGSPLLSISKKQATALQSRLRSEFPGPVNVELAMRYGTPSIASALEKLREKNCKRILILPFYPQYSATTTASVFDEVTKVLRGWRWVPELRFINQYHDDPSYIDALSNSIREAWDEHGQPEKLVFSFHGMPRQFLLAGDPYHCQCQKTGRLVAQRLGLGEGQWTLSFQSLFGKAEWLKPYTQPTLEELGSSGTKSVDVVCPGFTADCLETLEEIAIVNKDAFLSAGGKKFHYIPALNDRDDHISMFVDLVKRHTQGWPETGSVWDDAGTSASLQESKQRALAKGAEQ